MRASRFGSASEPQKNKNTSRCIAVDLNCHCILLFPADLTVHAIGAVQFNITDADLVDWQFSESTLLTQ